MRFGMKLLKFIPCDLVDSTVVMLSKFLHGNLAKYGLERPDKGPFLLKNMTGQSPVIDVGTLKMIKSGKIQVDNLDILMASFLFFFFFFANKKKTAQRVLVVISCYF